MACACTTVRRDPVRHTRLSNKPKLLMMTLSSDGSRYGSVHAATCPARRIFRGVAVASCYRRSRAGSLTGVTAIWDPSPHSHQVSHYEVCIGTSSLSCNIHRAMVNASQTSYAFAPPAGELVYVAVRASNHRGRGSYSTEQKFSIPSFTAPTNRSTAANAAITPINLNVSDPDGSPLTFTHTGLPFGVTMNWSTGRITGTPITAGTYNVTIFVSDGLKTVSRSFVWSVTSGATADRTPPALTITSHASGLVVTTARQTIRGTATDSGSGAASARYESTVNPRQAVPPARATPPIGVKRSP